MFAEYLDPQSRVVAWEQFLPFDTRDFQVHCGIVHKMADDLRAAENAIIVFHVESGSPAPGAKDRKDFFEALERLPSSVRGIVISQSPVVIGAITAIRWLGLTKIKIFTFTTFEQACQADHFSTSDRERIRIGQRLIEGAATRRRAGRTG